MAEVCTKEWHERQDAGHACDAATAELQARFPAERETIAAWYGRFDEMIAGAFADTVALAERLAQAGVPLYALTNWPRETFPPARARFPFFRLFRDVVVSGEEGVKKPDPRIFAILLGRGGFCADEAVFIDDVAANVAAAEALGLAAIHHRDAATTAAALRTLGLPV